MKRLRRQAITQGAVIGSFWAFSACASEPLEALPSAGVDVADARTEVPGSHPDGGVDATASDADVGPPAVEAVCARDGDIDFRVAVHEMPDGCKGSRVVAVGLENWQIESRRWEIETRLERLFDAHKSGAFVIECPRSLHHAGGFYPAWAIWVDCDGDGRCGDSDFGFRPL